MKNIKFYIFYFLTPKIFRKIYMALKLVLNKRSYLVQTGYIDSVVNNRLANAHNQAIPWMPYSVVDLLDERLTKDLSVFEYGSGVSSLFFALRCKKINSIEYDKIWYKNVLKILLGQVNATVHFVPISDGYPSSILNFDGLQDVVIIDGRKRIECAKVSLAKLSNTGVVIFDDTKREKYQEAFKFYKDRGFKQLTFRGIKATGFSIDQTTIFYREGNCLGL